MTNNPTNINRANSALVVSHNQAITQSLQYQQVETHLNNSSNREQLIEFLTGVLPLTHPSIAFLVSLFIALVQLNPNPKKIPLKHRIIRIFLIATVACTFLLLGGRLLGKITAETDVDSFVAFLEFVKSCSNFIKYMNYKMLPAVSSSVASMPAATITGAVVLSKNLFSNVIKLYLPVNQKKNLDKFSKLLDGTGKDMLKNLPIIATAASFNLASGLNPFATGSLQRGEAAWDFIIGNIDSVIEQSRSHTGIASDILGAFSFIQIMSSGTTIRQEVIQIIVGNIRTTFIMPILPYLAIQTGTEVGELTIQAGTEGTRFFRDLGTEVARRARVATRLNLALSGIQTDQQSTALPLPPP